MLLPQNLQPYFADLKLPAPDSHKGQNGKLLIIGGSELFHAASKWSLDVASKFVDMVFYSSVPSNNDLVKEAKGEFWNGIVIARDQVEAYIDEADCILIGPGMTRTPETTEITNTLLTNYPTKKWVIDAGALQMLDPSLLKETMILTPHQQEFELVWQKKDLGDTAQTPLLDRAVHLSQTLHNACILVKGQTDIVAQGSTSVTIAGGHPGMTKGGTGDVLAGLVAALYCTNSALTAAVVGSYGNKKAGEALAQEFGPFFNASDLVQKVPSVLWNEIPKED